MTPLYPAGVYAPLPRFSKKTQTNIAPSVTRNTASARCSRDAPIISVAWSSKGPLLFPCFGERETAYGRAFPDSWPQEVLFVTRIEVRRALLGSHHGIARRRLRPLRFDDGIDLGVHLLLGFFLPRERDGTGRPALLRGGELTHQGILRDRSVEVPLPFQAELDMVALDLHFGKRGRGTFHIGPSLPVPFFLPQTEGHRRLRAVSLHGPLPHAVGPLVRLSKRRSYDDRRSEQHQRESRTHGLSFRRRTATVVPFAWLLGQRLRPVDPYLALGIHRSLHSRRAEEIHLRQVHDLVPAAAQHCLEHEQAEPFHLLERDGGRHRQLLPVHWHLDQRRTVVLERLRDHRPDLIRRLRPEPEQAGGLGDPGEIRIVKVGGEVEDSGRLHLQLDECQRIVPED